MDTLQAEIVTIGTELLLGEIVDTNSAWIAQRLTEIGLNLFYTTTVGDNLERAAQVLRQSLERSDITITTGGLGPTVDDVTREAVAKAIGCALYTDDSLLEEIQGFFARRNRVMTASNRRQAQLPQGAQVIHNPVGTAPAFIAEKDGHIIISLPGVPFEMKYLMEHEVLPYIRNRYDLNGVIKIRVLRTCNIGESTLGERIADLMELSNPTVGTAAHPGQTDVRIAAKADSEQEADALIAPIEARIREVAGEYIFGVNHETIEGVVAARLQQLGQTLAVVEIGTPSLIIQRLAGTPEAANVLKSAMVAANAQGLALDLPTEFAQPSQELADAAAIAIRHAAHSDLGLAVCTQPTADDQGMPTYITLATPGGLVRTEPYGGRPGPLGQGWVIHLGLDTIRRYLTS